MTSSRLGLLGHQDFLNIPLGLLLMPGILFHPRLTVPRLLVLSRSLVIRCMKLSHMKTCFVFWAIAGRLPTSFVTLATRLLLRTGLPIGSESSSIVLLIIVLWTASCPTPPFQLLTLHIPRTGYHLTSSVHSVLRIPPCPARGTKPAASMK